MKSVALTINQFTCLAYILFTNQWIAAPALLAIIQAAGIGLGIWAVLIMSRSKLSVMPVPREGATLISSGPYRMIRHPMYLALIMAFYPMLMRNHGVVNLLVFGLLLLNMLVKLNYEEKLLRQQFPAYNEMVNRTWRLIPWIY